MGMDHRIDVRARQIGLKVHLPLARRRARALDNLALRIHHHDVALTDVEEIDARRRDCHESALAIEQAQIAARTLGKVSLQ